MNADRHPSASPPLRHRSIAGRERTWAMTAHLIALCRYLEIRFANRLLPYPFVAPWFR